MSIFAKGVCELKRQGFEEVENQLEHQSSVYAENDNRENDC